VEFCCCQCVPIKFPLCSHQVPNNFSLFNAISFALSFTLVIYRTSPKEEVTMYLFGGLFKAWLNLWFFDGGISPGQKWWWTVLEHRNLFHAANGRAQHALKVPCFFFS
jgi:hypothetical protein